VIVRVIPVWNGSSGAPRDRRGRLPARQNRTPGRDAAVGARRDARDTPHRPAVTTWSPMLRRLRVSPASEVERGLIARDERRRLSGRTAGGTLPGRATSRRPGEVTGAKRTRAPGAGGGPGGAGAGIEPSAIVATTDPHRASHNARVAAGPAGGRRRAEGFDWSSVLRTPWCAGL
jgi:hypothetical protein